MTLADGAQGRDRTADTVIFSHVLYQLSYLGARDRAGRPSKLVLSDAAGGAERATRSLTVAFFAVHPAKRLTWASAGGPAMR